MKRLYKDYLFQKHILVSEASDEKNAFEVVFSLANLFGIRIVSGEKLAETAMIENCISAMIYLITQQLFLLRRLS